MLFPLPRMGRSYRAHGLLVAASVADQCIVSITTFATGVLAARHMSPTTYGTLALYLSSALMLSGLQNALLLAPLRVHGADASHTRDDSYFRNQLRLQQLLALIIVAGVGAFSLFSNLSAKDALSFTLYCLSFQLQELCRCIMQTRRRNTALFIVDLIGNSLRLGLVWATLTHGSRSLFTLLIALSIGHIVTAWLARPHLQAIPGHLQPIRATFHKNVTFGRWVLLEGLTYLFATQAYTYFVASWVGRAATAGFTAMHTLANGLNVVLVGFTAYLLPRARIRLLSGDLQAWRHSLLVAGVAMVGFTGFASIALTQISPMLIAKLYRPFFAQYQPLVPILCFSYVLLSINTVFNSAFQTTNAPAIGFAAKALAGIVGVLSAYPLISKLGPRGAAYGLCLMQLITFAGYLYAALRGRLSRDSISARCAR